MTQDATNAFVDSLTHLTGFFIVIIVLLLLWGTTVAIGSIFVSREASRQKTPPAPSARPVAAPVPAVRAASAASSEPEPEEIAAVSAAIAMLMGSGYRILSIRAPAADWSLEGRRQHFASHKIR